MLTENFAELANDVSMTDQLVQVQNSLIELDMKE